jgi:hypothetical protein
VLPLPDGVVIGRCDLRQVSRSDVEAAIYVVEDSEVQLHALCISLVPLASHTYYVYDIHSMTK